MKLHLINNVDENTGISWWDENRKKLNELIRDFNDWQIVHRFDMWQLKILEAKIDMVKRYSDEAGDASFSEWQLDIIKEIEDHIRYIKNIIGEITKRNIEELC